MSRKKSTNLPAPVGADIIRPPINRNLTKIAKPPLKGEVAAVRLTEGSPHKPQPPSFKINNHQTTKFYDARAAWAFTLAPKSAKVNKAPFSGVGKRDCFSIRYTKQKK